MADEGENADDEIIQGSRNESRIWGIPKQMCRLPIQLAMVPLQRLAARLSHLVRLPKTSVVERARASQED